MAVVVRVWTRSPALDFIRDLPLPLIGREAGRKAEVTPELLRLLRRRRKEEAEDSFFT